MKTISTTALLALMTASIGLGTLAPVLAQQAPAAQAEPADPAPYAERDFRADPGMRHGGRLPGLFAFDRGAEAVEIAIVRLSHAIELTDQQQALLDTLKTDALAAIANFETATEGLRPPPAERETAEAPSISERFDNRIAVETARLAALEAVQPAFTAFFDSLTGEQQAELTPTPGERGFGKGEHRAGPGQRHTGPGPLGGMGHMGPDRN